MSKPICLLSTFAGLFAAAFCHAGGTIGLHEIEPLLAQQPAVKQFLSSSLDLENTVFAEIRFDSRFKYLGGARMGPYTIRAHPKMSPAKNLEIIVCTEARFVDATGNQTADEVNARKVEERLTTIMIRDANGKVPNCP